MPLSHTDNAQYRWLLSSLFLLIEGIRFTTMSTKKSKYYLFSTLFALLIRSNDGCYFTFSVASNSFFGCCVSLCISCLSFDLGFLVTVCNVDSVCVRMLFFHFFPVFIQFDIVVVLVLSMIQVSRIYERQ